MDVPRIRRSLLRVHGNQCWRCQQAFPDKDLTIDHLIPRSLFGSNNLLNLRLACKPCNQKRGNKIDAQVLLELTGCQSLKNMTLKSILEKFPPSIFQEGFQTSHPQVYIKVMEQVTLDF
ncbi:MAG: HNH endonuclease [Microcystaceae cyanobacterium]